MKILLPGIERFFQLNPQKNFPYHRYGFVDNLEIGATINKSFAIPEKSPLIPTDTDKFEEFLPLNFTTLNQNNKDNWKKIIVQTIRTYIESSPGEYKKPLERSFLFDLTDSLKDTIQTNGDTEKEKEFKSQFEQIKKEIERTIE